MTSMMYFGRFTVRSFFVYLSFLHDFFPCSSRFFGRWVCGYASASAAIHDKMRAISPSSPPPLLSFFLSPVRLSFPPARCPHIDHSHTRPPLPGRYISTCVRLSVSIDSTPAAHPVFMFTRA
ncbi:hypothetical protein DFP72DRAFT_908834 [Ephemerocybe angulata]|uniref:Uncharacterized protein n=1 Tax=Ephemerocybe angulata TaxID=980116 RepID=A0A8H6HS72_9AGAR|nr:hypothetical protein DFP72DRAFT_908834 [Tulosesus angulatus]